MKNQTIIVAVVVVLIVLGFFFFTNRAEAPQDDINLNTADKMNSLGVQEAPSDLPDTSSPTPADSSGTDEKVVEGEKDSLSLTTVSYTDGGFSPQTLNIKMGDTIRFTNESSGGMWVASAIHPTHALYPEKTASDCLGSTFDQCASVSNGESWEFTFNQKGEHKYHNHVRASKTGTIIVE